MNVLRAKYTHTHTHIQADTRSLSRMTRNTVHLQFSIQFRSLCLCKNACFLSSSLPLHSLYIYLSFPILFVDTLMELLK